MTPACLSTGVNDLMRSLPHDDDGKDENRETRYLQTTREDDILYIA